MYGVSWCFSCFQQTSLWLCWQEWNQFVYTWSLYITSSDDRHVSAQSHVTLVFIWSWLRGGKQQWPCLADLYSQTPQHSSSFSLFMKDVRHKATHEKRRYRTKRQKTNHGDGQDRRKWKHSRCREAQRFLGLKKWSECRLSVLQTRLDGFFVMWLTWPLHCPICLPGEAVGLLFAVRFGSLLIIINHYNQYSASSQQISFATLGWSWAES